MTIDEIRIRLRQGEDSHTQFKRAPIGVTKLAAELTAFTNSEGGIILFGIEDDGSICGLSKEDAKLLDNEISNASNDAVRPAIYPETEFFTIDGKLILAVTVPEGIFKPYADKSGNFWIKAGADKRRITAREELQRLLQKSMLLNADELPIPKTSIQDVDRSHLGIFLERNYGIPRERSYDDADSRIPQLLTNLGLMANGNLTLAGLLLFGKYPQAYRRIDLAKCVRFAGTDVTGTEYLDSEDVEGTLIDLFKGIMSFLKRNLRHLQEGQNFNSIGIPELPIIALEEFVVNMLLHRDYFVSSPWRIFIFDDRIELISPGSLPNHLTIEQMKSGVSVPRNPVLFSFAVKDGLPYRGIGSGIRRAVELIPDTTFENDSNDFFFKTIIPIHHKADTETDKIDFVLSRYDLSNFSAPSREYIRKLYEHFADAEFFRRAQATGILNIREPAASKLLAEMTQAGILVPVTGHGKGARRFTEQKNSTRSIPLK